MLRLKENEAGFDPNALGFPGVKACHAIVYETTKGLFGLHNFGGAGIDQVEPKTRAFASFVNESDILHGEPVRIYSGLNSTHRGGHESWRLEMLAFVPVLRFKGEVVKIVLTKHLGKQDNVYIEFNREPGSFCSIRYKRWSKMEEPGGEIPVGGDQVLKCINRRGDEYKVEAGRGVTKLASVIRTRSNKGQIHSVDRHDMEVLTFKEPG
jgi:hypothetical protein